jgi:hypothetical protein
MTTALTTLQQATCKVFEKVKSSIFHDVADLRKSMDLRPLDKLENFIEGGLLAGFWGLCAVFSGMSLYNLYKELRVEHPAAEKFEKIGKAVKTAFVDLISLGGATTYNIHWAHEVKILSLGQYVSLFKALGYGAALVIYTIEGGWSLYNLYTEKEKILKETSPAQQEKHKQRLCLALIKLIGNVSMVAWASLGIVSIALSLAVSPFLMSALLIPSCIFSFAAFFYQRHIENAPELCPLPKFNFAS